jgi:hypothetical protein
MTPLRSNLAGDIRTIKPIAGSDYSPRSGRSRLAVVYPDRGRAHKILALMSWADLMREVSRRGAYFEERA